MNAVVEMPGKSALPALQAQGFSLMPRTLDEALRLADMLAESDMVPKDFKGKPGNVIVAMQWGFEVGLKPLQSLQNIAVINGRPSMWGDALLALVRASPLCEYVLEEEDANGTAICRAKRRGEPEQIRRFSIEDAKVAGLHGKQGPWQTSPKRMRQMRARSFALRDVFTDVIKGMDIAEVVMDYTDLSAAPAPLPAVPPTPEVPTWPADAFATQLERWTKAVAAGLKTPADILALARSKGALTDEQEAQINALKPAEPEGDPQ